MAVLAESVTREKRNLIRVRMGNFPPRSRAVLTCFMYSELKFDAYSNCFVYRLPLTFVPVYLFGNVHPGEALPVFTDKDLELEFDGKM